jgi:hypothetical protein
MPSWLYFLIRLCLKIYSEENYPKEKVVNQYGVQDDYLYQFALPKLADKAKTGQPFLPFCCLLVIIRLMLYLLISNRIMKRWKNKSWNMQIGLFVN